MTSPRRDHVSWPVVALDSVMLGAVGAVALSPLAGVYGDTPWVRAAVLGLIVGIAVVLVSRQVRFGALLTTLLLLVGYVVVGPAAAAPDTAGGGILPTLDSVRSVLFGAVQSWRTAITQPVPLGSASGELVVVFVIALAGSFLAATFLWRSRVPSLAVLPAIAAFVASAAFGVRATETPLLRGLMLVVLLLVWLRLRTLRVSRSSWLRRVGLTVGVLSVAGVAGWGLAAAVGQGQRQVLRDHVEPPLSRLDFKSPLSRYRDYYKNHRDDVLFTFKELPQQSDVVRLATMDSFDGHVWNVSNTDLNTGSSAFRVAPAAETSRTTEVTIGDYKGPWIPTVGHATAGSLVREQGDGDDRQLLLNTATGTVAQFGDAREGDVYKVAWEPRNDSQEVDAAVADRSFPMVPMKAPNIDKLDNLARDWAASSGADNDYETARALAQGFRDHGYFNDGLDEKEYGFSPSGHGVKRLADMVSDENRIVGNDEQYASAMAYSAQRMGLPARVVLGFENVQTRSLTGDDIAAWVEIPFEGHGWVVFDPTPDERKTPPPLKNAPDPAPQPFVVQPPLLPEVPADVQGIPPEGSGRDLSQGVWDLVLKVLAVVWVGVKIVLLLAPLWLILLAKWWRRRRRRKAAEPLAQISGAWREFTDRARDMGVKVPPGYTRHEAGTALVARFPATEAPPLAATADRHVFGPGEPSPEDISAYWLDVDSALRRMRKAVPWWRRWLARFSPASLPWRQIGHRWAARARAVGNWLSRSIGRVKR